jgi:hypothetical protein
MQHSRSCEKRKRSTAEAPRCSTAGAVKGVELMRDEDLLIDVAGYHYPLLLSSPPLPARVTDVSFIIII